MKTDSGQTAVRTGRLQAWFNRIWYGRSRWFVVLLPLSWMYVAASGLRRQLYRYGILRQQRVLAAVIVVGNITAGGTGKTPLTIWLARQLLERGLQPGVVARGYGAQVGPQPLQVSADSDPAVVGDEALLLATCLSCPVVVHPDRVAAANGAVELGANVIVADDGLQHYRLARDFEIAVIDGARGFGNKRRLPAGPLRESISRLDSVDKVLVQQDQDAAKVLRRKGDPKELNFRLVPSGLHSLHDGEVRDLHSLAGQRVHALAGIGNPPRFFSMLIEHGLQLIEHPLPDHAPISQSDLTFDDDLPVIMTEKDAVKCRHLYTGGCWYVAVEVEIDGEQANSLVDHLHNRLSSAIAESAS